MFDLLLECGTSWGFTYGVVWLICKLVGWTFSWKIATAVWVAICAAKFIFDK